MQDRRRDFPLLQQPDAPTYLDSACVSLRPNPVLDEMQRYYTEVGGCAGRALHRLGRRATEEVAGARETIARFFGASAEGTVFTKNTTEAINLVAHAFPWRQGDVVVTSDKEHNSNLVPWQRLRGVGHETVPVAGDGTLSVEDLQEFLQATSKPPRLLALTHTSNVDGLTLDATAITRMAHDLGVRVLWDGAQAAGHREVDLAAIGADFYTVSFHKMLGPAGGALIAEPDALAALDGFVTGGHTVSGATARKHTLLPPPARFEAGLQDYAGILGAAAACDYLEAVGRSGVARHEARLNQRLHDGLAALDPVDLVGPQGPARRGGITAFNVRGLESHDVAAYLDDQGIAVRSGHHCNHAYFHRLGVDGAVRASLYLYNNEEDVARFLAAMERLTVRLPQQAS